MRSFTNKLGEVIEVSKEHLDTAVKIKKELQKASPSFRCNWRKLKKLMEEEGFLEAEASEAYRCMIKSYQSSIGELDSKEKYADLVTTSKLQSIKDAIGEISYANQEVRVELTDLRKLKKELTLYGVVAEQITNLFSEKFNENKHNDIKKINISKDGNKALIPFTDWHIGLITENFNYEIAEKRVSVFVQEIIKYCELFKIKEIYLAGLGDLVENVYMRTTQAKDTEFNFSEQIVKSTELVVNMINKLRKFVHVNYLGIVMGNHDRMFIKGQTLENDSAMRIIDFCVTTYIQSSSVTNVSVKKEGFDGTSIKTNINGFNFKMVHGDNEAKNNLSKIKNHISLDNVFYDMLIFGHFHNFGVTEENGGRICLNIGCLQGSTGYSKTLGFNTDASQAIVVITENEIIPIRIGLDFSVNKE